MSDHPSLIATLSHLFRSHAKELKGFLRARRGEQRTLTLADGSTVELNTATQVHIDYGLDCRCITLSGGEAVFRIAHGDPRCFEVKTSQGRVRDIVAEFSRYHAVDIDIDARLQNYRLSGRLPSADLDDLFKLIQAAYPVSVRRPAPERLRIELRRGGNA